ncbi:Peptidase, M20 (Glutamate carboxypeptidase) family [Acidipropionibacterium acidipropionici ATCC 4875]|uniref:Peptidase, M20 (Glutamate carboxypeptidase) family n=1 Tax=Acidipropionibacterium acidipropionici (strain ATCC 4875 / DSM 20272 / JCM 6432 / NBRC 12425 / NCIMB 8070 / 4) TaxID=1171373 RepID=K7RPE1_ACIA4|nr:M20/M25/M40 family metallo-hydrolase [Acidipropionibacterium acidipropionici]AFV88191.1 Peptidase, M20 (Glutamate carboxypeptidase) family [Acidipropionibacterium acidipropionici ATCC 4875]
MSTADLDRMLADLRELVAIPSVSADPSRAGDVAASAEKVAALFRGVGVETQVVSAGGAPAVVGRRQGPPGAPTVLLYAHHDVQPVADDWHTDPFTLTIDGERAYGRGAADDKAGVAAHLEALRLLGEDLPVSVAVLVEGEEEVTSPTLGAIIDTHAQTLRADVVLAPDAVNAGVDAPAITTSLRGILNVRIGVRTAARAVHSGIYSGVLPDALGVLVHLLDSLTDDAGRAAIPGIAADPDPADPSAAMSAAEIAGAAGTVEGLRLASDELAADLWTRPSVTVLGIDAPRTDAPSMVLTPQAAAVVSLRLPPSVSPAEAEEALRRHLEAQNLVGAEVSVKVLLGGRGWSDSGRSSASDPALNALSEAFGRDAVTLGVDGGIPFIQTLTERFPGIEPVITAVQDPSSAAHGADESVSLRTLAAAAEAEAGMLRRIAGAR